MVVDASVINFAVVLQDSKIVHRFHTRGTGAWHRPRKCMHFSTRRLKYWGYVHNGVCTWSNSRKFLFRCISFLQVELGREIPRTGECAHEKNHLNVCENARISVHLE